MILVKSRLSFLLLMLWTCALCSISAWKWIACFAWPPFLFYCLLCNWLFNISEVDSIFAAYFLSANMLFWLLRVSWSKSDSIFLITPLIICPSSSLLPISFSASLWTIFTQLASNFWGSITNLKILGLGLCCSCTCTKLLFWATGSKTSGMCVVRF